MDKLLGEYRETLAFTRKEIRQVRASLDNEDSSTYADAESYLQFLNSAESNLLFVINHFDPKPKQSNAKKHSIERITVEVENDDAVFKIIDKYSHDTPSADELKLSTYKRRLIKEMLSTLTKQQRDILDLFSRGFTHKEISGMLGCTRQNITKIIKTVREKIIEEGWLML